MTASMSDKERRSAAIQRALAREIVRNKQSDDLATQDGLWWAQNLTKTYDEHARKKGVLAYKPFPVKEYFELLWHGTINGEKPRDIDGREMSLGTLKSSERIAIPKSREMMTSWLVCAYITWHCQYFERTRAVVQTQKETKAIELVEYCRTLYCNQPTWMQQLHPLRGRLEKQPVNYLKWDNGSQVIGIPSGADQIRSYHPTILVLDEAAHLSECQATYDFATPVCSQIILVSSAAPGWFGDICSL
jgi:hypothetical protein